MLAARLMHCDKCRELTTADHVCAMAKRRAMVIGLQAKPELNGAVVEMLHYNVGRERYAVQVDGAEQALLLRPENLLSWLGKDGPGQRQCWGCARLECPGEAFKRCKLCIAQCVASPCYFCTKDCRKLAWPEHEEWHSTYATTHAKQAEHTAAYYDSMAVGAGGVKHKIYPDEPECSCDTCRERFYCQRANAHLTTGRLTDGRKDALRALRLNPKCSDAYALLGEVERASYNTPAAGVMYTKALEYAIPGTQSWAHCIAFAWMFNVGSKANPGPGIAIAPWIVGDDYKPFEAVARRVVEASPEFSLGWMMLAKACKLVGKFGEVPAAYRRCAEVAESEEARACHLAEAEKAERAVGSAQ